MTEEALKAAGESIGIKPEANQEPGTGRRLRSRGPLPNLKHMSKKDLIAEAGKSRKRVKELEAQTQAQTQGGQGVEELAVMPPEMWGVFPAMLYEYMASRYGEHWRLNETEVKLYGENLERVANRYLGEVAGDNPEVFGLVLVVLSTTVPRVLQTVALRRATPETEGENEQAT